MLRHPGVRRPNLFQAEECGERLGGYAAAPKGAVDPAIFGVHAEFLGMAQFCSRHIKRCVQNLTALSGQVSRACGYRLVTAHPAPSSGRYRKPLTMRIHGGDDASSEFEG